MNHQYTYIIIDDDSTDRRAIETALRKHPEFKCAGSFDNCKDALPFFTAKKPDIIFTDIHVPRTGGPVFIQSIIGQDPITVVISSHPEFALQSFELKAFDFILKPVETDRLAASMQRVTEFLTMKENAVTCDIHRENIYLKEGSSTIQPKEIVYLEAFADYTKVATETSVYLTKHSLTHFTGSLPGDQFMRIHRNYVVAIGKVQRFDVRNVDMGGSVLPVGKNYVREAKQIFKFN